MDAQKKLSESIKKDSELGDAGKLVEGALELIEEVNPFLAIAGLGYT